MFCVYHFMNWILISDENVILRKLDLIRISRDSEPKMKFTFNSNVSHYIKLVRAIMNRMMNNNCYGKFIFLKDRHCKYALFASCVQQRSGTICKWQWMCNSNFFHFYIHKNLAITFESDSRFSFVESSLMFIFESKIHTKKTTWITFMTSNIEGKLIYIFWNPIYVK